MIGFPNCALEDCSRQNPNVKSRRSLDVFHHSHSMPSNGWISWIRRNRTQSDTVLGRVSHVSKRFNLIDLRRTQQLETCKDFSRHILMTLAVSYRFVNRYVIFIIIIIIIIIIVIISSSSSSSPLLFLVLHFPDNEEVCDVYDGLFVCLSVPVCQLSSGQLQK